MRWSALVVLLLLAAYMLPASHAQSGIRHCVDGSGQSIFTDRACSELQATERLTVDQPPAPGTRVIAVRSCARSPDDLLFEVRSALEARDVNRLAGAYLWTGIGTREAYALMGRLDRFSSMPMVDAQLVGGYDYQYAPPSPAPSENSAERSLRVDPEFRGEPGPDSDMAMAPPRPLPGQLRIDQMRSEDDPSAQVTYFQLARAAGCWWIRY